MPPFSFYYVTVYRNPSDPRGYMALNREPVPSLQKALGLAEKYVSARTEYVGVPWKAEIRGEGVTWMKFELLPNNDYWNRTHLVVNDGAETIFIEREDVARAAHFEEVMEGNNPAPIRVPA